MDVAILSPMAPAAEPVSGRGIARLAGTAVALGICLLGAAAPAAAQALQATPPTSQSQVIKAPARSAPADTPLPGAQRPAPPDTTQRGAQRTPAADTTQPPPLPAPRPSNVEPVHMFTGAENHFSLSTRTQNAPGEKYTYGQFEAGRQFTLDLEKGPWRSETTLDAAAQVRLGARLEPADSAGNITAGLTLGENLSRDLGHGFSAYGRAAMGIQGGAGTRFEEDEPLNAFTMEGALGVQHTDGVTTVFAEPFAQRVRDLDRGGLSHDRVGFRIGAQHLVTERDAVQVELNTSRYSYSDGRTVGAHGGQVGWLHRNGKVWWGPQVGVERRDNGENRVNAGIRIDF